MHILFLSAWHPWPPDNGSRIRVSQLLRALAARHEVSLVTFAGEPQAPTAADLVDLGLCRRAVVLNRPPFARRDWPLAGHAVAHAQPPLRQPVA
ncbi:MAG: hypothetical protein IPL60_11270 [Ardenticatenia bacterium]|nr:hypothetical protein [Ardenticatenia bacterium]